MSTNLQPKPIAPKGSVPKRKATETEAEDDEQHSRKKAMRKKALRACLACQRAHLTCDDARPCARCQQRSTECVEGHRKKAKYLLDDSELEQIKRTQTSTETATNPPSSSSVSASDTLNHHDPTMFDQNFLPFGSEAANLEYSILSAILGSPDSSNSPPSQTYPTWNPAETMPFMQPSYTSPFSESRLPIQPSDPSPATGLFGYSYQDPQPPQSDLTDLQLPSTFSQTDPLHPLQPRYPLDMRPRSPTVALLDASHSRLAALNHQGTLSSSSKLQGINDRITKPYDYTQGYHFLMKHLTSRFEKNDILRIVRALAIFRPSLIALQMPLSLDDEVFVEKCFQRSLLELDKLISFSGTPTVVWRRTGEICLVAPEFCVLTGWSKEELVGQKKYIYELFENQSVVEYWENFASHAFENTTQSVYSHCVLLKPSGAPVPSTFCFSIRRDLFDLPSVVIGALPAYSLTPSYSFVGQWLPLL